MTRRHRRHPRRPAGPAGPVAVVVWLLAGAAGPLTGQVREWRLSEPTVRIDGGETPLYRVSDGAFVGADRVVVADAGNHRLASFGRDGRTLATLGREGRGPGEFMMLWRLLVAGDSVYAVDTGLARVTAWDARESGFATRSLPPFGSTSASVVGIEPGGRMLLHSVESAPRRAAELFVAGADVAWYRDGEFEPPLFRADSRYLYFFPQGNGYTTYRTPFFGTAAFALNGDDVIHLPLHGDVLQVRGAASGAVRRVIDLPVTARPFDPGEIAAVRDSLVQVAGRGSPSAERIATAFDGMEAPEYGATLRRLEVTPGAIWVERFPVRGHNSVRWWILDPESYEIRGAVDLDPESRFLDAREDEVLLVETDDWGVETVVVRRLLPVSAGRVPLESDLRNGG